MILLPIKQHLSENQEFIENPECQDSLQMSINFFNRIGYHPPWIGYYVSDGSVLIGMAAFKGKPVNGTVEIAYGTFPAFQQKGIATEIAKALVELALRTDASVRITARTMPENNYSTRVLAKNNFKLLGMVVDPEDGDVWEWEYRGKR